MNKKRMIYINENERIEGSVSEDKAQKSGK